MKTSIVNKMRIKNGCMVERKINDKVGLGFTGYLRSVDELFPTHLLGEPVDIPARRWPGIEVLDLKGREIYHSFLQELLKLTYLLYT